ncbi:hypothetical protein G6F57_019935 [Rhizopus arrhizus]|nr:hypothetical protein G6F57_019935 [Rhizopus arrhizus]
MVWPSFNLATAASLSSPPSSTSSSYADLPSTASRIGQAADQRRRRVGAEGAFEALFGVKLGSLVVQDQHAEVHAVVVVQVQAAGAQVAQEVLIVLAAQIHQQVVERFAGG